MRKLINLIALLIMASSVTWAQEPYRKAGPAVEKINGSLTAPAAPKIGVAKPKVCLLYTSTRPHWPEAAR